jgi:uncharacterized membrane protein
MYGAVAFIAGVSFTILVQTLIRANGRDSALAKAIGSNVKAYVSLVLYGSGIVLAFVSPWIAYGAYVAVAIIWFIPDSMFTRAA